MKDRRERDEEHRAFLAEAWDELKSAVGVERFRGYSRHLGLEPIRDCLVKCHRCGAYTVTRMNPATMMTEPVECSRRGCYTLIGPRGVPTFDPSKVEAWTQ